MTEKEELQAILSVLIQNIFPDELECIIKSLKHITYETDLILKKYSIHESRDAIMKTISESLVYLALNGSNIEND